MSSPLAATQQSSTRKSARGKVTELADQVVDVVDKSVEKQEEVSLERAATLPMEVEAESEVAAVAADLEEREGSAASTVIMESSSSRASAASAEVMEIARETSAIPMETSITRPSKSKVSSDLTKLAIDTPASPRRSRRASGLAPATELYDTLELRSRPITEVYSPLAKIGRSASEGATTLDTSRRSRARSGAVTTKEKEKIGEESGRMDEEEKEDGNMTVVELLRPRRRRRLGKKVGGWMRKRRRMAT